MMSDGMLALAAVLLHALAFLVLAVVYPLRRMGRPAAYFSVLCAVGSLLSAILAWQAHMGGTVSRLVWAWLPSGGQTLATVGVLADPESTIMLVLVALVACFPGLLFAYGDPELGKTASGLLGVLLVGWTYTAIGCFASSLTRSQVVGFLIAFVLLLCMLLLPAISDLGLMGDAEALGSGLRWLSTGEHFQQLLKGLVDTADLAYFAVVIGSVLLLTRATVESVRWR